MCFHSFCNFLFFFVSFKVWYKGYFVPIDAVSTECPTECPPIQPPTTTVIVTAPTPPPPQPTTSQSWGDAPAKIAFQPSKIGHHQNSDVEVFDSSGKRTTTKPKLEALDGEKQQQSNVNIEIHNVFSFASPNNSLSQQMPAVLVSPLNGQTDNKIGLPNDNPRIIYA